nr:tyrosine--tRNA ligase [Pseudomonadota bacterium]
AYKLVKNDEWLKPLSMIDFLRDVGKHFSVNMMMSKDSVKARFESREQGISYTEFSYMLLQSYDFYFLNKNHNCRLQVGGSDQWGNITAGLELIRRKNNAEHPQAYGMTFPLLMTSAGTKFGKTEKGAVWLDSERTSAYHFFQFWLNSADQDVIKYLNLFSSGTEQEISEIKNSLESAPEKREAQQYLAKNLTTLLHGESETDKAIQASRVLFGESMESLDFKTLSDIFSEVPSTTVPGSEISTGVSLNDLLVKCEVAQSKGAAKRLIEGGGIYLNNNKAGDANLTVGLGHFIEGKLLVIRSGKKNYHLVRVGSN